MKKLLMMLMMLVIVMVELGLGASSADYFDMWETFYHGLCDLNLFKIVLIVKIVLNVITC